MKTKNRKTRFTVFAVCLMLILQTMPTQEIFAIKEQPKVSAKFYSDVELGGETIEITASANNDNVEITGIKLPDGSFVASDKSTYPAIQNREYKFEVFYREAVEIDEIQDSILLDEAERFERNESRESIATDDVEVFEKNEMQENIISDEVENSEMEAISDVDNLEDLLFAEALAFTNNNEDRSSATYVEGSEVFSFKTELKYINSDDDEYYLIINPRDPTTVKIDLYIDGKKETELTRIATKGLDVEIRVEALKGSWDDYITGYYGLRMISETDNIRIYEKYHSEDESDSLVSFEISYSPRYNNIISSAGEGGNIEPSGTKLVDRYGTEYYRITPETGYKIADVLVDGKSIGAVESYVFTNVNESHSIQAKFESTVEKFDYKVNINDPLLADVNIYINDVKQTSLEGAVPLGAKIRIEVKTIRGYRFIVFASRGLDEIYSDYETLTIWEKSNVSSPVYVQASIGLLYREIISQAEVGGKISPEGTTQVLLDDSKTYSIEPHAGYYIEDVIVDDESKGAVDTYTFENVDMDHKIVAKFSNVRLSKDIVSSAGVGGEISPIGITNVFVGETKEYTIRPVAGYRISDVVVDNVSIGPVTSYAFENVRDNRTIEAKFEKEGASGGGSAIMYTLEYNSNGGNNIESKTILENTMVQLQEIPVREGFTFDGWHLDSGVTMKITEVVMNENKTVYAKWKENKVDIPVVPPVEPPVVKPVRPSVVKPVGPTVNPPIIQPVVPSINESINSSINPLINPTTETVLNQEVVDEVKPETSGNTNHVTVGTAQKDAEEITKIVITSDKANTTIESMGETTDDQKNINRPNFGVESNEECILYLILWVLSMVIGIITIVKRKRNNKKIEEMMKGVN